MTEALYLTKEDLQDVVEGLNVVVDSCSAKRHFFGTDVTIETSTKGKSAVKNTIRQYLVDSEAMTERKLLSEVTYIERDNTTVVLFTLQ